MDNAAISYRPLHPNDIPALKALHEVMFPINYDRSFYDQAVRTHDDGTHGDGTWGWAAVMPQALNSLERFPTTTTVFSDGEQLVGFVTAKPFRVGAVPLPDRRLLGLEGGRCEGATLLYVLTLGVAEEFRRSGVATALLQLVEDRAVSLELIGMYLHVITYNQPAITFYERQGFTKVATSTGHYYITTGRALHADQQEYDACVFFKQLRPTTSAGGESSADVWDVWGALDSLAAPLRRTFFNCLPPRSRSAAYSSMEQKDKRRNAAPRWLWNLFGQPRT